MKDLRFQSAAAGMVFAALLFSAVSSAVFAGGDQDDAAEEMLSFGLITKTETNPFFVKIREGAAAKAEELGVKLLTAAGEFDGDNNSQVTAIENMVNAGVKGILLVANDTRAIVPTVLKARSQGVVFIALDTPLEPMDATDALFATDNFKAGVLIGQWARAALGGKPPVVAAFDGTQGTTVDYLRHNGFMYGFGLVSESEARNARQILMTDEVVYQSNSNGDQSLAQVAAENCFTQYPDVNVVYTVNEPTAFGVYTAAKNAGIAEGIISVSVDGGRVGVQGVQEGRIGATSQQYPYLMATLGIEALYDYAVNGVKPEGYTDTGVELITDNPQPGISSEDSDYGLENSWG